ncbi:hypothetical protein LG299_01830 [Microbacterium lacus]|uniref:hypothetical protein n=1 Tax=Microbacterium lacus TaxID=415217 RepID=UPI003850A19E
MPDDIDLRLLQPYRAIRRITAGSDGPFGGLLCRTEVGDVGILVDIAALPSDWTGWEADAGGHLLSPQDVIRRGSTHGVLLPVCAERLGDTIAQRGRRAAALRAGEAVTVAVSVLRGLSELQQLHADGTGEWWVTDTGRPVLVTEVGELRPDEASVAILRDVAQAFTARLAEDVIAAAGRERLAARDLHAIEDDLFRFAAAEPLRSGASSSTLVRSLPSAHHERAIDWRADNEEVEHAERRMPWHDLVARHVDADIADLVSRTTTAVWRRATTPRPRSRGRAWMWAAGAGAVVLAGGLALPSGAAQPAPSPTDTPAVASPGATETPAPLESAESTEVTVVTEASHPTAIVTALLDARASCGSDPMCLAEVMTDPAAQIEPGTVDLNPSERTVTLVDEFGGVAVVRVDAVDAQLPAQLVVIEQHNERWLLRDVYSVAQQPSGS